MPKYQDWLDNPQDCELVEESKMKKELCPRCKVNHLREPITHNALSRRGNKTYICSPCGQDEAIEAFLGTPKRKWKGER